MASTIAMTCRSLPADASTKASVMTSWSATSMTTMSCAFLSAAAWAAVRASSRPRSVTDKALPSSIAETSTLSYLTDNPGNRLNVQVTLGDVLDDAVGHQIPDRFARGDPGPAVAGGDRHGRHLDQADRVVGQVVVGEHEAGPGDPDEVRQREHLLRVLPGEDLRERVRAGDEEQLGVGP